MSIDRQMDKKTVVHIHNGVLLSPKKNTFESALMRWMKLEAIIQSEVSQNETHQYSVQLSSVQSISHVRLLTTPLSGLKGVKPPVKFGEKTRDCSPGQANIYIQT